MERVLGLGLGKASNEGYSRCVPITRIVESK